MQLLSAIQKSRFTILETAKLVFQSVLLKFICIAPLSAISIIHYAIMDNRQVLMH